MRSQPKLCLAEARNKIYQYAIDIDNKKWFLGMPKSRRWMLYAQQLDPFGLHNWFGFYLARATDEYAARTQFCEVCVSLLQHLAGTEMQADNVHGSAKYPVPICMHLAIV